jgi:SNF family Na+-dependent transporter
VVTSLLPYFFFIVLAIRGLFLEGAADGISYLLIPDFSKLFAIEIWIDAIVQVFYQMSVGVAGIINFSSLKPKKEKHLLGVYLIPLSITFCGMLCALNIFMFLGHFCLENNLDIRTLTLSGASLSFNIFPKALAILPWPNFWVFVFFIAMVFLGIDS